MSSTADRQTGPSDRVLAGLDRSTITRVGWVAKGLLFVVIGFLGLELARRNYRSADADQRGALSLITDAPAGRLLVLIVGAGLLLFAFWQLWSAVFGDGASPLELAERAGRFGVGIAYALTGVGAVEIALTGGTGGGGGDGGTTSPEGVSSRLLGLPGGRALIAALGIATLVVGAYQLWASWDHDVLDDLDTEGMDRWPRRVLTALGRTGTAAKAVAIGIIGSLLVVAAWQADPDEAAGMDQALRSVAELPFGRALLALISLGLMAAGLFDATTFHRRTLPERSGQG